jgi:two-component system sensor histidine kinase UhpB
MTQLAPQTSFISTSTLSVSYKSSKAGSKLKNSIHEAIIITDSQFIIKGFNEIASSVYRIDTFAAQGKHLFSHLAHELVGTTIEKAIEDLFNTGHWEGDVIYKQGNKNFIFSTRGNLIKDEHGKNSTIIISTYNISKTTEQEKDLLIVENEMMEIDKMYERYHFAVNASSDAIWDMDIATGFIYRSERFNDFTGYKKEQSLPSLDWFFDKIHEQDKGRVKLHIDYCINNNVTNWEIEYRFQVADGSYRNILDKAQAIYKDDKLIRVIGAMQNITERKKLEAQLLNEQVQKQKMINQAIIKAQEKERNRISGELHDNVNQLLMSAKLHICVAKNKEAEPNELLEKANEYLLMAVEEIRNLSKKLTSTLITNVGLQKSIADIASTMLLLKEIQLHSYINDSVVEKLSAEQQLMVYRIIQEQSNNILKYAETDEAIISLKEANNQVELIISDNGVGFDKSQQKANGIGFINIFNRVDAYNGKVEIITSPGNGCTLIINFPITE